MASDILGVLLAGGQSLRMGSADKFLLPYQGRPLLQHCLDRARPQVDELVISANGDASRLAAFKLEIIPDRWPDHPGPLAGIISVMSWAQKARKDSVWLASFATDTPYFPADLVTRLRARAERDGTALAIASSAGDSHYTFALWSMSLFPALQKQFEAGERALHRIARDLNASREIFPESAQEFFNINTLEDLSALSQ
ncbi:MAG: molybdenum cofactor guanylyltransferase [Cellvibrionaceae bacterium]|nr:molybdenum cofactor guanylyltransferase [Cellvibrionaceae bacterium]